MSGLPITLQELTVDFGSTRALDGVSAEIAANSITGLLGRNGAGKTTLLEAVASFRRPTAGRVLVDGRSPFEDEYLMERICLIRESGDGLSEERVGRSLDVAALARPTWDQTFAEDLLDAFGIDRGTRARKLSRGQRSALGATIGLASRAPITLFDEVHLGMDAPSRRRFYEFLIADYAEHPRTIVLSSHLISEVEQLLEHVIVLDEARVLVSEEAEHLRSRGATITGRTDLVDAATADLRVLGHRYLGPTKQATVLGTLTGPQRDRIRAAGLELGAVPLEDLFIALTEKEARS
ncbi:ATP-binding cassette domain-containing protein [Pseudactinotalea sp. HY160]|uniref:ATP-binding cassette domain-containing protein n=1 Tax=Pseudactinotalea sp. HY160 TaxID=2654490 RepID=UPI00128B7839|nr:ABC transporter ATP-binding protein [Pseudactinotalea sp. HY160]MPV50756.1 ATP-binding cassette domain-containing protein [Pseudactinotalea sp. HY160]